MRNLTLNESKCIGGGTACDQDEPTSEKVKDVLNDGLENVGDTFENISDKIHDKVNHHNRKNRLFF